MAAHARRRRPLEYSFASAGAGLFAWAAIGNDGGLGTAAIAALAGALLGVLWPLLAIIVLGLPGGLVPRSWRRWWRRGEEDRPSIRAWLRRAVLAADRHRCCYCSADDYLQVDHVFPWSLGGRSVFWNMMTLCGRCNRVKSNFWASHGRVVAYRPFEGHGNAALAERILRAEKRRRLSPLRIARAAIALL